MFKIEFETSNAAFTEGDGTAEVAEILHKIAQRIEDGETNGRVVDSNGNGVGSWSLGIKPTDEY